MSPLDRILFKPLNKSLYAAGHYHQAPGRHPDPITVRPGIEMIELVTAGRGWVELEPNEWSEVLLGSVLWHIADDKTIGRSDFKDPYQCLFLRFYAPPRINGQRPAAHLSQWKDPEAVLAFTNDIIRWCAMGNLDQNTVLNYALARLQLQIAIDQHQQTQEQLPEPLQRVLDCIETNYGDAISLKKLGKVAEWSIPQLHKRFREYLGKSPHQWLLERRIKAAREYLANSNRPIKQVAVDCGFYSAAAFCAQFKRNTGYSPSYYRKQMTHS